MSVPDPAAIAIDGRPIGAGHPPYLVAELSGNHNGDLGRARAMIDAAKEAGADAVKLQTYTADTMTIDLDGPGFRIESGLWAGRTLYDLYREAATSWDWHEALFAHARSIGLAIFSSPFDETAVDLLRTLDCPAYKIASFEATDTPLIARAAAAGRPLIVSTGMAEADEIDDALATARAAGAAGVVLLHCVSAYPAAAADCNLRAVPALAARTGCPVGLSDHTMGTAVSVAAVALGACLIEKHFTLARADGGPDAAFSMQPDEFAALVRDCRAAWEALGSADAGRAPVEIDNRRFRRSLYVVADVAAGEALTSAHVRAIRPGGGLAPKHLADVLGRRAARPLARGTPLAWDMLQPPRLGE